MITIITTWIAVGYIQMLFLFFNLVHPDYSLVFCFAYIYIYYLIYIYVSTTESNILPKFFYSVVYTILYSQTSLNIFLFLFNYWTENYNSKISCILFIHLFIFLCIATWKNQNVNQNDCKFIYSFFIFYFLFLIYSIIDFYYFYNFEKAYIDLALKIFSFTQKAQGHQELLLLYKYKEQELLLDTPFPNYLTECLDEVKYLFDWLEDFEYFYDNIRFYLKKKFLHDNFWFFDLYKKYIFKKERHCDIYANIIYTRYSKVSNTPIFKLSSPLSNMFFFNIDFSDEDFIEKDQYLSEISVALIKFIQMNESSKIKLDPEKVDWLKLLIKKKFIKKVSQFKHHSEQLLLFSIWKQDMGFVFWKIFLRHFGWQQTYNFFRTIFSRRNLLKKSKEWEVFDKKALFWYMIKFFFFSGKKKRKNHKWLDHKFMFMSNSIKVFEFYKALDNAEIDYPELDEAEMYVDMDRNKLYNSLIGFASFYIPKAAVEVKDFIQSYEKSVQSIQIEKENFYWQMKNKKMFDSLIKVDSLNFPEIAPSIVAEIKSY